MIVIAAFYRFTDVKDYLALKEKLFNLTKKNSIFGTILLSKDGINSTVSGTREAIDNLKKFLYENFDYLEYKESFFAKNPFYRMKIKIKNEILNLGSQECDPKNLVGTYVDAKTWDNLISQDDTIVLDVRNDYEVQLGKFTKAINPKTNNFREFAAFVKNNLDPRKHKKIAMSCTGGIRCEFASSFMLKQGFSEVYHLKGGVLQYLEDTKGNTDTWEGECYVFDQRVSVDKYLNKGKFSVCFACRYPISDDDKKCATYEDGVSCPKCFCTSTDEQKQSYRERQKQVKLSELRGSCHFLAQNKS